MKNARVIYNPTSGREAMKKALPDVLIRLEEAGYEASAHATTGEGCAADAAALACERQFDLIVAAGGDGTVNEVVDGMAKQPYRPKLGIIPMGTTNDFARAIKVPRDVEQAMDIIIDGQAKKLDIGKVNGHHFMNIAGGGKITELTYEVPSKLKTALGQLAYYLKGVEMLPSIRPTHARIEYDGEVFEGDIMLFLIANTNSIGGFEKLAPNAEMNDGYFDLLILKSTNIAEFIMLANKALKGNHIHDDNIIYTHAKKVTVEAEEDVQVNLDGEYGGKLPGTFENLYQHIEFLLPKE
ncbi:diacylglycerol kinase [Alkalibacillus haloalkaliphilus]|uniref:Diacylglycerol kinase n=1 Tax=Alkalibacillus haloalkaliphilus TaxID=94136 RepID=A0A511W536_9BACI|nr:diacylglycerol kinase [Alkalibacillus haloalkaliphilus]GEN46195.1 diacylglycerol kinase [Alkalibacillus haloalkaliphilus]